MFLFLVELNAADARDATLKQLIRKRLKFPPDMIEMFQSDRIWMMQHMQEIVAVLLSDRMLIANRRGKTHAKCNTFPF